MDITATTRGVRTAGLIAALQGSGPGMKVTAVSRDRVQGTWSVTWECCHRQQAGAMFDLLATRE